MKTVIHGGTIVNEGLAFVGSVVIDGDTIVSINQEGGRQGNNTPPLQGEAMGERVIDATGCYVLPGIIDDHVHFREPGLTEKADIDSESQAAAAGGVTSYFDMPNTVPPTTTLQALEEKLHVAAEKSHVNYAFFLGATHDNAELFSMADPHRIPGIKLFMGSSTGNMLVDDDEALERIFTAAHDAHLPLMTHCEDTAIIDRNMAHFKQTAGDDPDIRLHQLIRSEEACLQSTTKAIQLAVHNGTQLHIAHISTQKELEMIPADSLHTITAEATVGHLLFSTVDYERLGARIKVNPAIKSIADCEALRQGLSNGRISVVGTDHAPHLLKQKQGGCARAASGMPMVQFSLVAMLQLVDEGVLTIERMVELMAHNPARIFSVRERGFLRPGYKADIVIVRPNAPWTLTNNTILSKCQWSPLEGHTFSWHVEKTLCNGHVVYDNGSVDSTYIAQPVLFR
jgi:dihydroorotase